MYKACIVYGLASSKDGQIRYIGQTTQVPKRRRAFHVSYAKRHNQSHLDHWINKVLRDGHELGMVILDNAAIWNVTEVAVIAKFRAEGSNLLNIMAGGQGSLGWKKSDEERHRISASKKGHLVSAETRKKISATKALNPVLWTEERRAVVSEKMKNRIFQQEHRAKITAAKMGHTVSNETRQKIRATLKARHAKTAEANNGLHA